MGSFSDATKGGGLKAPSFKRSGGGNRLFNYLENQQKLDQKRQNDLLLFIEKQSLSKEQDIESEERSVDIAARKKAVTQATEAILKLNKLNPVLEEFEGAFDAVFPDAETQIGLPGKFSAGKTVFNLKTLEKDPNFAAAVDQLEGKRSQITKGLGEVGNLAEQEQKIAMQNVPQLKFGKAEDLFLPDAPATSKVKLRKFREFINSQIQKNLEVIDASGKISQVFGGDAVPEQQQVEPPPQQSLADKKRLFLERRRKGGG